MKSSKTCSLQAISESKLNLLHVILSLVNVSCSAFNGHFWWMVLANINVTYDVNAVFIL